MVYSSPTEGGRTLPLGEALSVLEGLASDGSLTASTRAEALFRAGMTAWWHGDAARARGHWQSYRERFPSGGRASEVERLLAQ